MVKLITDRFVCLFQVMERKYNDGIINCQLRIPGKTNSYFHTFAMWNSCCSYFQCICWYCHVYPVWIQLIVPATQHNKPVLLPHNRNMNMSRRFAAHFAIVPVASIRLYQIFKRINFQLLPVLLFKSSYIFITIFPFHPVFQEIYGSLPG